MNNHHNLTVRHNFLFFFDVKDGNPNGDPDGDNAPRIDPHTQEGLVTNACIKRKIRNYIDAKYQAKLNSDSRFKIYIQDKSALNDLHQRAYTELNIASTGTKQKRDEVEAAKMWMCENFVDIRYFGAVMTTKVNAGKITGPIQITDARSLDVINPLEITITRQAVTDPKEMEISTDASDKTNGGKVNTMGKKYIVPYGCYQASGSFSPSQAKSTGMDEEDLKLFWESLSNCFETDRAAARGFMAMRKIIIFSHESPLGNAPTHKLHELVKIEKLTELPQKFQDYNIKVSEELPEHITVTIL